MYIESIFQCRSSPYLFNISAGSSWNNEILKFPLFWVKQFPRTECIITYATSAYDKFPLLVDLTDSPDYPISIP